jgi:lysophospholipase L1-like esterase
VVRNGLLVVASLLVGLAMCEGLLRLAWGDALPDPGLYVLDPVVGKRMRPGWSGSEFGAPVRINSLGLRGPEISPEKPPETWRILALGDSWTFGFRIGESDTWPRHLEAALNQRAAARGEAPRYQVVNAGVIGYSTEQEAAYLRSEGRRFEPDLVILAFYPVNDLHSKYDKYRRYDRLRRIHPWLLEVWTFPRQLYLRQFIKGTRRALKARAADLRVALANRLGYEDPAARAAQEDDWTHEYTPERSGWRDAHAALLDVGRVTREIGAEGLVLLLPDLLDLPRYEDRFHARVEPLVRGAVQEAGLEWLDLLDTFRPWRDRVEEVRADERRHPNGVGYRLIAEAVAAEVERRYLAPPATLSRPTGTAR